MLTVPEVAKRVGRDPETVRRWIRSGKLRARKMGTQHVIDESDLAALEETSDSLPLPEAWKTTWTGEPQPNWGAAISRSREGRDRSMDKSMDDRWDKGMGRVLDIHLGVPERLLIEVDRQ